MFWQRRQYLVEMRRINRLKSSPTLSDYKRGANAINVLSHRTRVTRTSTQSIRKAQQ